MLQRKLLYDGSRHEEGDRMALSALIFDMDGLMVDTERLYFASERDVAARFGKEVKDGVLWKMMGRKPVAAPEKLLEMRDEIMRRKLREDLRPMPGLERIVGDFHGTLRLAVATGATREFLDIVMDRLGLRDRFDVLQHSDDIVRGKPDPEIYVRTCSRLALPPGDCAVLEDSENGVVAAKAAGCRVIAVPSEYSRTHDFSRADFVAPDLFRAASRVHELLRQAAIGP
jgi:HAD superfamily hydrolase (TIGR01509 family)